MVDLMLSTDPGALPEAGWDVLSAWLHSGLASRRIPPLPRQIRGARLILWLAPSRSGWRPPQKDPLQIKYAVKEIWEGKNVGFGQFAASQRAMFSQARKSELFI